jgi:branched-chain amino acid transport system substrate-binding protein
VDNDTLPAQGKSALGIVNTLHYADTLDTPNNKAFVASYRARFNTFPSVYSEYGYVAVAVLAQAAEMTDGDMSDKDKLAVAMEKVQFEAPRGPFRIDPVTHNPIQNIYVREVAEIDGRLTNKIIGTLENVRDPGVRSG